MPPSRNPKIYHKCNSLILTDFNHTGTIAGKVDQTRNMSDKKVRTGNVKSVQFLRKISSSPLQCTDCTVYCAVLYWRYSTVQSFSRDCTTVCVCVFCHPIYSGPQTCGCTSRGHTGERSNMISHPSSFCGACLNFYREKHSAVPFPRRP